MVISISFVIYGIWSSWGNIHVAFSWKHLLVLLLSAVSTMGSLATGAMFYKKILEKMSGKLIKNDCSIQYFRANLYKYLPGNVMHYIGRNEIASDGIVSFKQINVASAIEIVVSVVAISAVALLFAGRNVIQYIYQYGAVQWIICGIAVLGVAACITAAAFKRKIAAFLKGIITPEILRIAVQMVAINVAWNILGNAVFVCLLQVLGCEIPPSHYFPIIGICAGAWLVGFLTPGAPGGIGVREAMLNILLSGLIPTWAASLAGILIRAAQIVGELLIYVITVLVVRCFLGVKNNLDE